MLKATLSNLLGRLRSGRFSAPSPRNPTPAFYAALKRRDQLSARDVRAIAVHEAGHALLYAALRQRAASTGALQPPEGGSDYT